VSVKVDRLEETVAFGSSDLEGRLFTQLATLPPDGELEDALWAIVSTFAEGLDDLSVGVCVPQFGGDQLIVRHAPRPSQPRVTDAARLFPETEYELVLSVPFDAGTTLHIGSDSEPDSALRRVSDQLALAVGSTIRRARFAERIKREVLETEELRERAVQNDKLAGLGRMAASIVHELNNPLTSIVAYTDYLRRRWDQPSVDPSDRERLGRISEAANRVLSFTRDLVAYSRPSTADPSALSIHDVVERALVFCEHLVSDRSATIVREYGELPPIRGLHGPLTQVFVNLITNACQATSASGGSITIESAYHPDRGVVVLRVRDEGHGIEPGHIDRLFEPYFTTRGDGGGSGLGLNIVKTIVVSHGGSVAAGHNEPRGAVFSVELPTPTK